MDRFIDAEVWVMVGEDGQYTAHTDPDQLNERFDDECDGAGNARRVVKITVRVPLPAPVEVVATVSAEPDGATVTAG